MTNIMSAEEFDSRIWEALAPVDSNSFEVIAAPAPDANMAALLEKRAGANFPHGYLDFSAQTNGLCVVARENLWPPAAEFSVGPAWTFWRGLTLLGIDTDELPEWASIGNALDLLDSHGVHGVLPLLKIWGDSGRLWGVNDQERTVFVHDGEVTVLDRSFAEVYAEQIAELMQRQLDYSAEYGGAPEGEK